MKTNQADACIWDA